MLPAIIRRRRFGAGSNAFAQTIRRMFPGYLSGDRLVCDVPSYPEWHIGVAGELGDVLDCSRPLPGEAGTGVHSTLDCTAET